jgi:hypothetical protein
MRDNPLKTSAYCRRLAIVDHLRECVDKYDLYKSLSSDLPQVRKVAKDDLDRELMDLYILLEWEWQQPTDADVSLYEQRLARFEGKWKAEMPLKTTGNKKKYTCENCKNLIKSEHTNKLFCSYHSDGEYQHLTFLDDYCNYFESKRGSTK